MCILQQEWPLSALMSGHVSDEHAGCRSRLATNTMAMQRQINLQDCVCHLGNHMSRSFVQARHEYSSLAERVSDK